ncbi:hypothetical protein BJX65DRAFT_271454 [Aspergillus insuetus]
MQLISRLAPSTGAGLLYSNQCRGIAGNDCCLNRGCSTDVGNGYCRNSNNQTCEGEYVVGSGVCSQVSFPFRSFPSRPI